MQTRGFADKDADADADANGIHTKNNMYSPMVGDIMTEQTDMNLIM